MPLLPFQRLFVTGFKVVKVDSLPSQQLVGQAFAQSPGGASRGDRLACARMRGLEARHQLATAEGGSFSSEEVARLLGISKTAFLKRHMAGRLQGWREERLQTVRFPQWQFDARGQTRAALQSRTLGALSNRDPAVKWLDQRNVALV